MLLIVGLGNPGKKYEGTRHNVGFAAMGEFARGNNFPDFRLSKKFNAEISESAINDQKIIIAKPQTFMNNSGKAVEALTKNHKLKTINLIILHDDIDLPLGKIKISQNRGAAGHKGVESIIKELKTKNFVRFRIGIKPQKIENRKRETERLVLQKFAKEEEKIIKAVLPKIVGAIEKFIKEGQEKAMWEYNK